LTNIFVNKVESEEYHVTVSAELETKHNVKVSQTTYLNYTKGKISQERLLEFCFDFLLQRESNTSILNSFKLEIIEVYFPEFKEELKKWLDSNVK
tara:strand:- start:1311 stop:1595 length:285 start_codon:yes stop_codon:yes gene_type:complete